MAAVVHRSPAHVLVARQKLPCVAQILAPVYANLLAIPLPELARTIVPLPWCI